MIPPCNVKFITICNIQFEIIYYMHTYTYGLPQKLSLQANLVAMKFLDVGEATMLEIVGSGFFRSFRPCLLPPPACMHLAWSCLTAALCAGATSHVSSILDPGLEKHHPMQMITDAPPRVQAFCIGSRARRLTMTDSTGCLLAILTCWFRDGSLPTSP